MTADPWAEILATPGAMDPLTMTTAMRPAAPFFDGTNLKGAAPLMDRIPIDADDPGFKARQWQMGEGARPAPDDNAAVEPNLADQLYASSSNVTGPPQAVGSPSRLRVMLSWGRDPSKIVVGLEDTATGDVDYTVSVSIDAWQQVTGIIERLVGKVKDLTGGDWRDYEPQPQPHRKQAAARPALSAAGNGPSRITAATVDPGPSRRRRPAAAAADRGRDDPAGRTDGRAGATDDGSGLPATDD